MEKKRSVGVTVFGIIMIIVGILGILSSLVGGSMICSIAGVKPHAIFLGVGFLFTTIGIMYLIGGFGVLSLKPWARNLTLLLSSFNSILIILMLLGTVKVIVKDPIAILYCIPQILLLFLLIGIIYFFTRPKVKEQFK